LNILRHHLALLNTASADIVVEPDVGKIPWYQFVDGQNKILAGETAMKEVLPRLQEIIHQKNKNSLKKYLGSLVGNN
jgi:hypothetical protein